MDSVASGGSADNVPAGSYEAIVTGLVQQPFDPVKSQSMRMKFRLRAKPTAELLRDMERVDVLWMRLNFAIDILANASRLSREQLINCCDENGYGHVADCLALLTRPQ